MPGGGGDVLLGLLGGGGVDFEGGYVEGTGEGGLGGSLRQYEGDDAGAGADVEEGCFEGGVEMGGDGCPCAEEDTVGAHFHCAAVLVDEEVAELEGGHGREGDEGRPYTAATGTQRAAKDGRETRGGGGTAACGEGDKGRPRTAATGTHGRRRNRRLRRRGYFLSWAAKKEARMVPEMLW